MNDQSPSLNQKLVERGDLGALGLPNETYQNDVRSLAYVVLNACVNIAIFYMV